jgi:hypothetical protein
MVSLAVKPSTETIKELENELYKQGVTMCQISDKIQFLYLR